MHEMRHAQSDTGVGGAQTGGLAWSYFPGWMVPGDLCQQLPTYLQKVAARPTALRQKMQIAPGTKSSSPAAGNARAWVWLKRTTAPEQV